MLALSRKRNQAICLDNGVRVHVVSIRGDRVTLGIRAPREVTILREELIQADHLEDFVEPPDQCPALSNT